MSPSVLSCHLLYSIISLLLIFYAVIKMVKQLAMILIIMQFSLAQQTQEGAPYSQIYSSGNNYQTVNLPYVDHDALLEEDAYREMGTPYRYG